MGTDLLDLDTLRGACDGDAGIYERIRAGLGKALPAELARARASLDDAAALREVAHRLHGMIGVASSSVAAIASDLEDAAAAGALGEAAAQLARLDALVPALLAALARWSP